MSDAITKQQGLDRIMIGWNGTSAAVETDRDANPMLQDVNFGWLYKIRTNAPEQVLDDGDLTVFNTGANNPGLKKIYVKAGAKLFDESLATGVAAEDAYSSLDASVPAGRSLYHDVNRDGTEHEGR